MQSVLYDSLVGLSLDIESPELVRQRLENANPSLERAAKLGSRIMGEVTLPYHRARLAVIEGHGREALQLIVDLDAAQRTTFPRWRARLLAVQLEARRLCGMLDELDSIASQIHECFVRPGHRLDWPATVLARYWLDSGRRQDAQRFASVYVTSDRRERYPAPELLLMLAGAAGAIPPPPRPPPETAPSPPPPPPAPPHPATRVTDPARTHRTARTAAA